MINKFELNNLIESVETDLYMSFDIPEDFDVVGIIKQVVEEDLEDGGFLDEEGEIDDWDYFEDCVRQDVKNRIFKELGWEDD